MNVFSIISKRRSEIMGYAAIVIIVFHAFVKMPNWPLRAIFNEYGSLGVDFFVFLAGFGLVYSLEKSQDLNRFFKRRFERILPQYYVALVILLIAVPVNIRSTIAHFIPVSIWFGYSSTYWYISATMVYYALVPLFYNLIKKAYYPRIMLTFLLVCTSFVLPAIAPDSIPRIAIMRIPVLVIGVAMGVFRHTHAERRDRLVDVFMLAIVFFVGRVLVSEMRLFSQNPMNLLGDDEVKRLYRALIAPLMLIVLAFVFEAISRTPLRFINAFFRKAGQYSLELYLSHAIVRQIALTYFGFNQYERLALMLIFSFPLALGISYGGKYLLILLKKLPILRKPDSEAISKTNPAC